MVITEGFRDKYFGVKLGTKMRRAKSIGVDTTVKGWWDRILGINLSEEQVRKLECGASASSKPKKHTKVKEKFTRHSSSVYNQPKNSINAETQKFLSEYVYNDCDFDKSEVGHHINKIIHYKGVDWDIIQEKLLRLEHRDFCLTNYWRYISAYQLIQHTHHCNRCPRETSLQTHHKTYLHKGREIFFMDQDLEVLCSYCHRQEHGI